jgi:L-lactate dehydrogenase complex protein LldG
MFGASLEQVNGEFISCSREQLASRIIDKLRELKISHLLVNPNLKSKYTELIHSIIEAGIEADVGHSITGNSPKRFETYEKASAGLTGCIAGFADTGTIVVAQQKGSAATTSLLPPVHVALLDESQLYPSMQAWLNQISPQEFSEPQSFSFITGPSRTADIEMTLTIGVHGPKKVIVFGFY